MDIPGVPRELVHRASTQAGLVARGQLLAGGISAQRLATLRHRRILDRVTRNVYSIRSITFEANTRGRFDALDWRRTRSAWMGLLSAPRSVATGMAALALHAVWGLPPAITPEITMPGRGETTGAPGVRVRQFKDPFPCHVLQGRHVAAPEYALSQALPELGVRRAVAVVDSALNKRLIQSWHVDRVRERLRGQRGVRSLGRWWDLVDGRAASPMETYVRLDCGATALPAPELQVEIADPAGQVIARGDLGWQRPDGSWVLAEIDGKRYHEDPAALYRDRARQNAVLLSGRHTLLRFTGRDVLAGNVLAAVARALAMSAAAEPVRSQNQFE